MRTALLFSACLASLLFTGCGLIAYPRSASLPPEHFRSITVREAGSRRLLSSATVSYRGQHGTNWIRLEEPMRASVTSQPHTPAASDVVLTASPRSGGQFVFAPVHRAGWSHVLFPIGLPLGGDLQHYYLSSVVASAPGHSAVRVSGRPSLEFHSPFAEYSDSLTILLPRTSQ